MPTAGKNIAPGLPQGAAERALREAVEFASKAASKLGCSDVHFVRVVGQRFRHKAVELLSGYHVVAKAEWLPVLRIRGWSSNSETLIILAIQKHATAEHLYM